jgi:2',3'-cyclic-nucleotide 2'-phosphodiesterase/3'-nucleotidase
MSAQRWVNYLKAGKDPIGKPNAIIALTHIPSAQNKKTQKIIGKEIKDFCYHIHGVDVIISAHSHLLVNGEINHIHVIQAMKYGQAIGTISLVFNDKNQLTQITQHVDPIYSRIGQLPNDAVSQQIFNHYFAHFNKIMQRPVATIMQEFTRTVQPDGHSTLGKLTCDAIKKETGASIVLMNRGAIRNDLMPGNITSSDIYSVWPFDDTVVILTIRGDSLLRVLKYGLAGNKSLSKKAEYSGIRVSLSLPFKAWLDNGQPINPHRYYRLAIGQCLLDGGDGYSFRQIKSVDKTNKTVRDIVTQYLEQSTS